MERKFSEFSEFSKFKESDNESDKGTTNLKILSVTCVFLVCGGILVTFTRGNRFTENSIGTENRS